MIPSIPLPMWFVLMFLFVASAWNSVQFLRYSNPAQAAALDAKKGQSLLDFDRKAAAYAETGLLFGILGLITGMLWAHYAWGAAWSNDIKQLMTAVALLIYLAYFILRRSFDEPEKGARLAAVYNIFAFSSLIPLLYIVPRMFASLHPGATITAYTASVATSSQIAASVQSRTNFGMSGQLRRTRGSTQV